MTRPIPRIPSASGALQAAILRLELDDPKLGPGAVAGAFLAWSRVAHGLPRRARFISGDKCWCEYCAPERGRDELELAMHRLPKRSARELRQLVAPLDERYIDRTVPLPNPLGEPWWMHRT